MPEIITDDGVRLHYLVEDYCDPWRDAHQTVLLYHGYLKSLEHWTPFVPAVARHYRVVRFDVRGAGKSGVPRDDAEWSVDRLIADALNLMDALGIRKVHWAGFESGGLLGLILAANRPERVASVACFNTPYRSPGSENTMKDLFRCGYPTFDDAIDQLGVESWVRKLCESGVLIRRLGRPTSCHDSGNGCPRMASGLRPNILAADGPGACGRAGAAGRRQKSRSWLRAAAARSAPQQAQARAKDRLYSRRSYRRSIAEAGCVRAGVPGISAWNRGHARITRARCHLERNSFR
jgi:pimeloyl-ACP methyl ester carboxylesterase